MVAFLLWCLLFVLCWPVALAALILYAAGKTADNHWVVTGPHIMLVGPGSKSLGYPETKDPDPGKPYMMWSGTPYEHAMIPVGSPK